MRTLLFILISIKCLGQFNPVQKPVVDREPRVLSVSPLPTHGNIGDMITATVIFSQGSPTYQWYSNGSPISGATNNTYTIQSSDAGTSINCIVSVTANGKTTSTAFIPMPAGRDYYVNNTSGSSGNDGYTPATAFVDTNVTSITFVGNERIFFNRGDTFIMNGNIAMNQNGIQIDAYGTGANPILDGSIDLSSNTWTNTGGTIYTTPVANFKWLMKDGQSAHMGTSAWLDVTSFTGSTMQMNSSQLNPLNSIQSLVGSKLRVYEAFWMLSYEYNVTGYNTSTGVITVDRTVVNTTNKYFLYNQAQFLTNNYDWFYDGSLLYIKSPVSPNTLNLRAVLRNICFNVTGSNCSIKNVQSQHYEQWGVYANGASNLTVDGVSFNDIKGMAVYGTLAHGFVGNNITMTRMGTYGMRLGKGVNESEVLGTTLTNITATSIGMDSNYGMEFVGYQQTAGIWLDFIRNPIIQNITISNVAYAGLYTRTYNGNFSYSEISDCLHRFIDGGAVYSVGTSTAFGTSTNGLYYNGGNTWDHILVHDIPSGVDGSILTPSAGNTMSGFYLDNYSYNNKFTKCTVYNIPSGRGFNMNVNNPLSTLDHNTVFNCGNSNLAGVTFKQTVSWPNNWDAIDFTVKCKFTNNIIFAKSNVQYLYEFENWDNAAGFNPTTGGGSSDNNFFLSPYRTNICGYRPTAGGTLTNYTLATWQSTYSIDASSSQRVNFFTYVDAPTADSQCKLYVNSTMSPVTVNLTGYKDKAGTALGSVTIQPFESFPYTL